MHGIRGVIFKSINSYFRDSFQFTEANNATCLTYVGALQGSILGPLMYLAHNNNKIFKIADLKVLKCILDADDVLFAFFHKKCNRIN